MENWNLVKTMRFVLSSWSDTINLYETIDNFDGVKVLNIAWTTPTINNNTMEVVITSHPNWNIGRAMASNGYIQNYFYQTFLDPRATASLYYENANPIIGLPDMIPQLSNFKYEILINSSPNDPDINVTSPVYIELGFFRRKK